MKKFITITGILFLTGLFILPMTAFGRGGRGNGFSDGMMRMAGPQFQQQASTLTAEQISQIADLRKKFRDDNADILKQLMTKRFDLNVVFDSDNPDPAKAKTIQKEISALNAELAQKEIDLYIKILKIDPNVKFRGGMGMGKCLGMRRM